MRRKQHFVEQSPILYLVATPIGNRKEFSPRAIEILQSCDYIGCEDTRTSGLLFQHFNIHASLVSCHEHNENEASAFLIHALKEGKQVAYVSDAGYPGISDPGQRLVKKALEHDIDISVVSGSCAFLPALIGSGLSTEHFYFYGFLPSKESARQKVLEQLKDRQETLLFYESPHRIQSTCADLFHIFQNRQACIARELTKLHEEYIRGTLEEFTHLDPLTLKGEMVIVVEGAPEHVHAISDADVLAAIETCLAQGKSKKDAIQEVSKRYGIAKNALYALVHQK